MRAAARSSAAAAAAAVVVPLECLPPHTGPPSGTRLMPSESTPYSFFSDGRLSGFGGAAAFFIAASLRKTQRFRAKCACEDVDDVRR